MKHCIEYFNEDNPKSYPLPVLDDDAMIRHVWDIEQIRDLMSLRSYLQTGDQRQRELDELWVSEPAHSAAASYGSNWGYYVGKDEIARWYVGDFTKKRAVQMKTYCAAHPGVENKPENYGAGCMFMAPLSTSLIRVADDGNSAKGIWYSIAQESDLQPDGSAQGRWMNDKVCADFVKENGQWKLFHLVVSNDQNYIAGQQYDAPSHIAPGQDPVEVEFGTPTVKMVVHDNAYNWSDNYPPMPEPYETLAPSASYGPEGHPKYKGGAAK